MTDKSESATNNDAMTTADKSIQPVTKQTETPAAEQATIEQAVNKKAAETADVTEPVTPKPTAQPIAMPAPEQVEIPVSKASGKGIAWLSLLVALTAVGATGYLYWQAQYKPQNWLNQLNQVDDKLGQISSQQQEFNQLGQQVRQQQLNQQRQFEQDLQSRLQTFANDLAQSQQQTYANQQAELSGLLNQVKQNSENNKNKVLLNDVAYLVKQAQYKLVLEKNPNAALLAMQLAANTLQQSDFSQHIELSAAISQDIGVLTELAKQQNQDMYLALAQIIGQVRLLPMQQTELEKDKQAQADLKPTAETSWQNLAIVWRDFLELFTPKKRNENVEALLTPEQSQNVELNLISVLHQAQWAALNKNPQVLSAALKQAANWLSIYYQTNDIRVMDSIDKLIELSAQDITGNLDKVELTSLELVVQNHD